MKDDAQLPDGHDADVRLTEALLEANLIDDERKQRLIQLVDGVLDEITEGNVPVRPQVRDHQVHPAKHQKTRRRFMMIAPGIVATLLAAISIGFLVFGGAKSAQAAVQDALEKMLASGPRRYSAVFKYEGPVRGRFNRDGACYLDGSDRFVFEIPSPMGIQGRVWKLGCNGQRFWGMLPSGVTWQGESDQFQSWWESRGLGDVPLLHIEAILETLGRSYELTQQSSGAGDTTITGSATGATPPRWADEIELTIDGQSGFVETIQLRWDAGRVREISLNWDRDAIVSPDRFEIP